MDENRTKKPGFIVLGLWCQCVKVAWYVYQKMSVSSYTTELHAWSTLSWNFFCASALYLCMQFMMHVKSFPHFKFNILTSTHAQTASRKGSVHETNFSFPILHPPFWNAKPEVKPYRGALRPGPHLRHHYIRDCDHARPAQLFLASR